MHRRILVGIDGSLLSSNALESAFLFCHKPNSEYIGVFVDYTDNSKYLSVREGQPLYFSYGYDVFEQTGETTHDARKRLISRFNAVCKAHEVQSMVHSTEGLPTARLVKESAYCDLMITGFETYFSELNHADSPKVLRDVLREAKCPVLVLPESVIPVRKAILTYDGKESSVYAIKQFSCLFPDLAANIEAILLSAIDKNHEEIDGEKLMLEYLRPRFKSITVHKTEGQPDKVIVEEIESHPDAVLVMGAYSRSALSMFFKNSVADAILAAKKAPVFIAHH